MNCHAWLLLQECLKVREDEIVRLGKEASRSRNVDALALQHRCEAQECLILQLTEQVMHGFCQTATVSKQPHLHLSARRLSVPSCQARRPGGPNPAAYRAGDLFSAFVAAVHD